MSEPNGIVEDVGQDTPSDIDDTVRFSGPLGRTQQEATGPSRAVASQSVVAASSAAPAGPTPTAAQLEENIVRRLMEQLQQMVIQQQQQPPPSQQTANDDDGADPPEEEDPWSRARRTTRVVAVSVAVAPIANQGQTSDNTWNTSDNK